MLFLTNEEKNMKVLFNEISNTNNSEFIFLYSSTLILDVLVENFFETDNGEDIESDNYEEYNAFVIEVKMIIIDDNNEYKVGELFELNYKNFPIKIKTLDGRTIYQDKNQEKSKEPHP